MKYTTGRRDFLKLGTRLAGSAILLPAGSIVHAAAGAATHSGDAAIHSGDAAIESGDALVQPGNTAIQPGEDAIQPKEDAIGLGDKIITVNGEISASSLGFTLVHEHVMVDFIGAAEASPSRYNIEEVFDKALPYLQAMKKTGCKTFADCTPAWLGRDAALLKRLSEKTGLNILTNTGYYGAAKEKYIPQHAYTETAEQLARRWIREFTDGIDNAGIRPGFIKIGVDSAPLSELQQKLVKAAAITHLATGLTIFVHTNGGQAALEEMRIVEQNGVSPEAWTWVHAQNETDRSFHLQVARAGGWISFDNFHPKQLDYYLQFLTDMKQADLLHRVILSHDAGWYHVGEKDGGDYLGYTAIAGSLLPALRKNGFGEPGIRQLFHENPARLFAIRKRAKKIIA